MKFKIALFLVLSFALIQSNAQSITTNIRGNSAEVYVSLPGGLAADFTISFDNVIGLSEQNLGLSAQVVNVNDLNLLNRLPSGLLNSIPLSFPVIITVEPAYDSGLSFEGMVSIDFHTHNLDYTPNTPLRMFKAPLGGEFRDITDTTSSGSYRSRSTTGTFSQFMIVTDTRSASQVSAEKLMHLHNKLTNWQTDIDATVYSLLSQHLATATSHYNIGDYSAAEFALNTFIQTVSNNAGVHIPNVWRASRDIDNVAGELMAHAKTLKYSIRLIN